MHISEGVLSAPVLISGAGAAIVCTGIGLRKIESEQVIHVAILTAAFFVASLIHVPVGPGSVHLVLNGLLGVLLGWACFPAILIALLLQAVFFQYGGLTVLGVNTLNMGVAAIICYYLVRPWIHAEKTRALAAFIGGFGGIFLAAMLMAVALGLSDKGFLGAAKLTIISHVPVMIIEGFVTMFVVTFLARVKPEVLRIEEK